MSQPVSFDRAIEFLVEHFRHRARRAPDNPNTNLDQFGYEIWVPNIAVQFHQRFPDMLGCGADDRHAAGIWHAPVFLDAAWYLARQGVLRPSVYFARSNTGAAGGQGFSLTAYGREWIQREDDHAFIFAHPGAYGKYLERYTELFGKGYSQRANQALQCFSAGAHLAACAMAGAAAESIILAAAIIKLGSEEEALRIYRGRSGTKAITDKITETASDRIKRDFQPLTEIIKHWRNPSSHGEYAEIDDVDAMTALTTLVRFAQFMNANWASLTEIADVEQSIV